MIGVPAVSRVRHTDGLSLLSCESDSPKYPLRGCGASWDIRNTLEEAGIGESIFGSTYTDTQNKQRPCYILPRRECDLPPGQPTSIASAFSTFSSILRKIARSAGE